VKVSQRCQTCLSIFFVILNITKINSLSIAYPSFQLKFIWTACGRFCHSLAAIIFPMSKQHGETPGTLTHQTNKHHQILSAKIMEEVHWFLQGEKKNKQTNKQPYSHLQTSETKRMCSNVLHLEGLRTLQKHLLIKNGMAILTRHTDTSSTNFQRATDNRFALQNKHIPHCVVYFLSPTGASISTEIRDK